MNLFVGVVFQMSLHQLQHRWRLRFWEEMRVSTGNGTAVSRTGIDVAVSGVDNLWEREDGKVWLNINLHICGKMG